MRVTVVVCVTPPPLPVTVIGYVPARALLPTVIVMVDDPEPGAGMELGLKLTVTLPGWPLADNEIDELKPPEIVVVIVECPEFPGLIVSDVGDALMVKLGLVPVTVSDTVVVS